MSKLKQIFKIFLIRQPSARCRRWTSTLCLFDSLLWRDTVILCFDERIGHCWNLRCIQYRMDKCAIYNSLHLVWMFMDSWRVPSTASISHFVFWQHLYLALRSVFDSQNTLNGRTESCILIPPTTNIICSDVILVISTLLLRLWSNNDKNFWKFKICHSNLPASIPATSDLG